MSTILIRPETIVTMDDAVGVLRGREILIEGCRIAAIGEDLESRLEAGSYQVIDAEGMIAIPGLVNAHVHMWQTVLRGLGVDWSAAEHHLHTQTEIVPVFSPEDMLAAELFGALNLLNGGTTTVYEWCHGNRTPDHSDAAIEGLTRSGIRSVFIHGTVKTLPLPSEPHFSLVPHPRDEAIRLRKAYGDAGSRLTLALGILGPEYSGLDVCAADFRLAADLDLWSSAHAHGRMPKVEGGYRRLLAEGVLRGRHNAVHMNSASDDELRVLADTGCSVTATAEAEIHHGIAREPVISRFARAGGTPSIGTDSEVNTRADMLETMRVSLLVQRLFNNIGRAAEAQGERPVIVNTLTRQSAIPPRVSPTARDALYWATMGNARAMGLEDSIGSLTVGKFADIALVRMGDLNIAPVLSPVEAVVSFATPANVDTVIVHGELVKRGGVMMAGSGAAASTDQLRNRADAIVRSIGYRP